MRAPPSASARPTILRASARRADNGAGSPDSRCGLRALGTRARRVTITPDTKVPNAATLVIEREDHTVGNLLRMQLLLQQQLSLEVLLVVMSLLVLLTVDRIDRIRC